MYDSGIIYTKYTTLKDCLIKELGEIERFSLCDYKELRYYSCSESHQLDINPHRRYFYSINGFLRLVSCKELEKWIVTGMRKDSIKNIAEIYIKRMVPNTKPIYSQRPYKIKKVIINGPATIIFWGDGTKTVVKCDSEDAMDKEKGILYAAVKKLSTKETYNDILRMIDMLKEGDNL